MKKTSPRVTIIQHRAALWQATRLPYRDFAAFSSAIQNTVGELETTYKQEVASLMTPNFQNFNDTQVRAA